MIKLCRICRFYHLLVFFLGSFNLQYLTKYPINVNFRVCPLWQILLYFLFHYSVIERKDLILSLLGYWKGRLDSVITRLLKGKTWFCRHNTLKVTNFAGNTEKSHINGFVLTKSTIKTFQFTRFHLNLLIVVFAWWIFPSLHTVPAFYK